MLRSLFLVVFWITTVCAQKGLKLKDDTMALYLGRDLDTQITRAGPNTVGFSGGVVIPGALALSSQSIGDVGALLASLQTQVQALESTVALQADSITALKTEVNRRMIQSGFSTYGGLISAGTNSQSCGDTTVYFSQSFASTPEAIVSLAHIDNKSPDNVPRARVSVVSLATNSFTWRFCTWDNAETNSAMVSWVAYTKGNTVS